MNESKKNSWAAQAVKNFFSFKTNDKLGILIALIILLVISSILSPSFLSAKNLLNILKQNAMLGLVTIGMTVVILSGSIDLSVGPIVAFCGLLTGYLMNLPFAAMLAVALVAGAAVGVVNGYLIAKQHMEPFIVTLSVQIALRGLNLFLTKGGYISKVNTFNWVGNGKIGLVPVPAIILIVMFLLFHVVMSKTVFGRNVYALGGNETAAKLSGIKTERVKIISHVICGVLCAAAAIINVSRLATAEPLAADGLEADAIAAALVGGNSLLGGRGSISGAFIGLLVFAILSNIFNLVGLKSAEQQIIKGVIIVVAVLLSQRRKSKSV